MNRLLEQAIVEVTSLPEDQQEAIAACILEEVKRHTPEKGQWARVADRLARLDTLKGQSVAFEQHVRKFRDGFQLRDLPPR